jgi:hypothetical protein
MATEIVIDPPQSNLSRPIAQMPALSPEQIASSRAKFQEATGSAELFDKTALKDGISIRATSAEAAKDRREWLWRRGARSFLITNFPLANRADIPADHFDRTVTELRTFARDLGLSPSLGSAVVERVSQIGPAFAAKSPDEQKAWVSERTNELAKLGINEKSLEELQKSAAAVLRERGGKFGQVLANSPGVADRLVAAAHLGRPRDEPTSIREKTWPQITRVSLGTRSENETFLLLAEKAGGSIQPRAARPPIWQNPPSSSSGGSLGRRISVGVFAGHF